MLLINPIGEAPKREARKNGEARNFGEVRKGKPEIIGEARRELLHNGYRDNKKEKYIFNKYYSNKSGAK